MVGLDLLGCFPLIASCAFFPPTHAWASKNASAQKDDKRLSEISFQVHRTVQDVPASFWQPNALTNGVFVNPGYLSGLEKTVHPDKMQFFYVSLRNNQQPYALFCFTKLSFGLRQVLNAVIGTARHSKAIPDFNWHFLICGNMMVSGAAGIAVANTNRSGRVAELIHQAALMLNRELKLNAACILVKDLPPALLDSDIFASRGYREVEAAPVMTLTIRPRWHSFNDYLASLNSKYRTTINKYRASVAILEKRELDASGIKQYAGEIDRLYHTVYSKAPYKGPFLGHGYFLALREQLNREQFQVIGYFRDQALLAFNSRMMDQRVLYSSFFGYDDQAVKTYALFKNMLLDDIQYAAEHGLDAVNFGRGTYEVKSAFGAEPQSFPLFIRPLKLFPKLFLPVIKAVLKPRRWTPRRPFKNPRQSS